MRSFVSGFRSRVLIVLVACGILSASCAVFASSYGGNYFAAHSRDVTYTEIELLTPSSTESGNLLLAHIAVKGGAAAIVSQVPWGWTEVASTSNEENIKLITYYKFATTTQEERPIWKFLGQTTGEGAIARYVDVDQSNPFVATSTNAGFGELATTSPLTTTSSSTTVLSVFATEVGRNNQAPYFSTSTGMTQIFNRNNDPFGPSMAGFYYIQPTAGSTGIATSTISGNRPRFWAAHQMALRNTVPIPTIMDDLNLAKRRITGMDVSYSGYYAVPSGGSNKVAVVIAALNSIDKTPSINIVSTSTGSTATSTFTMTNVSGNSNRAEYWVGYLVNPVSGTLNFTYDINNPPFNRSTFYVFTVENAAQSSPIDIAAVTTGTYISSKTTSATSTVAGDLLFSMSFYGGDSYAQNDAATATFGTGETEIYDDLDSDLFGRHVGAQKNAGAAGLQSMTTNWSTSVTTGGIDQVLIGVKPAQ